MKRNEHRKVDLIELGSASGATRGPWGHYADDVLMQDKPGLTKD